MPRVAPPPAEAKLIAQRMQKLHSMLNRVAYGKLQRTYDPRSRIFSIEPGQGSTEYGFRLFDGERFLSIQERYVVQGGNLLRIAYRYQLAWPDDGAYQIPNEWVFRFEYDSEWGQRSGFAGVPHLNAHHPQPVGPDLLHYPTPGLFPAELFFRIVQFHFPQRLRRDYNLYSSL